MTNAKPSYILNSSGYCDLLLIAIRLSKKEQENTLNSVDWEELRRVLATIKDGVRKNV